MQTRNKYLQYSEFIRDLKFIKQLVITEAFTSGCCQWVSDQAAGNNEVQEVVAVQDTGRMPMFQGVK